jgi:hypothetical protein
VPQTVWEDDNWQEVQAAPPQPKRLQIEEPRYYEDEEDDNWSNGTPDNRSRTEPVVRAENRAYQDVTYTPVTPPVEEENDDMWGDDTQSTAYQPQKINIPEPLPKVDLPQTVKQVEYQQEEQH